MYPFSIPKTLLYSPNLSFFFIYNPIIFCICQVFNLSGTFYPSHVFH